MLPLESIFIVSPGPRQTEFPVVVAVMKVCGGDVICDSSDSRWSDSESFCALSLLRSLWSLYEAWYIQMWVQIYLSYVASEVWTLLIWHCHPQDNLHRISGECKLLECSLRGILTRKSKRRILWPRDPFAERAHQNVCFGWSFIRVLILIHSGWARSDIGTFNVSLIKGPNSIDLYSTLRFQDFSYGKVQLERILTALETLKSFRNVLQSATQSIIHTINTIQTTYLPLAHHVGINSLPDELLSLIFEAGSDPSDIELGVDRFPITISHVCRHFRQVALGTPRIWTAVCPLQKPDELAAYLKRSKAAKLYVTLSSDYFSSSSVSMSTFLGAVVHHTARWISFQYRSVDDEDVRVLCRFSGLSIPCLTDLDLDLDVHRQSVTVLIASWSLPSVQHFTGGGSLPQPSWGHTLTSFDLVLKEDDDKGLHLLPLLSALQNTPFLESFSLKATDEKYVPIGVINHPIVNLDRLCSFTLELYETRTPHWLSFFCYSLHTPNLQKLSLMIDLAINASARDWTFNLNTLRMFPRSCLSPACIDLQIISCFVEPSFIGGDEAALAALWMFPSSRLQEISIQDRYLRCGRTLQQFLSELHLKVLRFEKCDMLSADVVHGWMKRMRMASGRQSDAFEKLEIVACQQFNKSVLAVEDFCLELGEGIEIRNWWVHFASTWVLFSRYPLAINIYSLIIHHRLDTVTRNDQVRLKLRSLLFKLWCTVRFSYLNLNNGRRICINETEGRGRLLIECM